MSIYSINGIDSICKQAKAAEMCNENCMPSQPYTCSIDAAHRPVIKQRDFHVPLYIVMFIFLKKMQNI